MNDGDSLHPADRSGHDPLASSPPWNVTFPLVFLRISAFSSLILTVFSIYLIFKQSTDKIKAYRFYLLFITVSLIHKEIMSPISTDITRMIKSGVIFLRHPIQSIKLLKTLTK